MPANLPSADELGLAYFEQLLGHGGKQQMRALVGVAEESQEKPNDEEQLDVAELESLLGPQEG